VANAPKETATEFVDFLARENSDILVYDRAPPPPGTIWAAGFGFEIVRTNIASVASIASLLWMAYEKFVVPKKKSGKESAIFIDVIMPPHIRVQIRIGGQNDDKEAFVKQFSNTMEKIREIDDPAYNQKIAEVMENTKHWLRRSPKK
jgi:hypothetical protein